MTELPVPSPPSPLRTAEEAAVFFRIIDDGATPAELHNAVRAVHRLVQQNRLRPVRIGRGRYTFARAELERFVRDETAAWKNNGSTE